ncbi:uncharacterized protein HRG_07588 [Hirsutella rhossiliensis]|uniref:Uncharacterized protein n=1 Tax=Hirsutella rhossiliensis TaxID=111463 RepID=A0A9P8MUJ9_9HYPO|nr:uncharacterized protein HRG_07588 [Hirsutella rhossiliensis]KAH0961510.1 hypothetical protein HRG_07588 [Hirsutella rhossiliensis]
MFATQHYMEAMHDPGRKRLREDDEGANGFAGFGEHRNKRLHSLPLRSSPKAGQQWPPASVATPVHNDALPRSHFSPWSSSPLASSQPQDAEMDMSDSAVSPSPYRPSFAAQVRGQHCEWAGPGPDVKTLNGIVNMGHHQTGLSDDQCVPRVMANGTDWHAVHNNRRLPSPISEAGDTSQYPASGSASMVIDVENGHQYGLPEASLPMHSPPAHAMHHPNAMMDVESQPPLPAAESEPDLVSPSPGRRGHVRSKHTVNSWTWQPGMKKSFSIGYRSDCEKCRLKVPGHFNHIVIS